MKHLFFLSLVIIALITSCKKDEPQTTYFVVNNSSFQMLKTESVFGENNQHADSIGTINPSKQSKVFVTTHDELYIKFIVKGNRLFYRTSYSYKIEPGKSTKIEITGETMVQTLK